MYKNCHKDAEKYCSANDNWNEQGQMGPSPGRMVFSCLYRQKKFFSKNPEKQVRLSNGCGGGN